MKRATPTPLVLYERAITNQQQSKKTCRRCPFVLPPKKNYKQKQTYFSTWVGSGDLAFGRCSYNVVVCSGLHRSYGRVGNRRRLAVLELLCDLGNMVLRLRAPFALKASPPPLPLVACYLSKDHTVIFSCSWGYLFLVVLKLSCVYYIHRSK